MKAKAEILILIVIFLLGFSGFSVYKYLGARHNLERRTQELIGLREKNTAIAKDLEEYRVQTGELRQKNKALEEEINSRGLNLEQLKRELAVSRQELASLQRTIEELNLVNQGLSKQEEKMRLQVEELSSEKSALEGRLNSAEELKKMLRDLIRRKRTERLRKETVPEPKKDKKAGEEGNRGYIVYHGKPTFKSKISIEVIPVPE